MSEVPTPHYQLPIAASSLGPYANLEQDVIKNAFSRSFPFQLVKSLPNSLKANHVLEARANQIDQNILTSNAPDYKRVNKYGLFSTFDYMPSEYGLQKTLETTERLDIQRQQMQIHPEPFVVSKHGLDKKDIAHLAELQPSSTFIDTCMNYESDPFSTAEDTFKANLAEQRERILSGPFIPGGHRGHGNRSHLPEIIQALGEELDNDWGDTTFDMYCDDEDLVMIQFEVSTVDSEKGLLAYMNMLLRRHAIVSQYGLSKIVELWNYTHPSNGCVYYALKPAWVRRSKLISLPTKRTKTTKTTMKSEESKESLAAEEEFKSEHNKKEQSSSLNIPVSPSRHNKSSPKAELEGKV